MHMDQGGGVCAEMVVIIFVVTKTGNLTRDIWRNKIK